MGLDPAIQKAHPPLAPPSEGGEMRYSLDAYFSFLAVRIKVVPIYFIGTSFLSHVRQQLSPHEAPCLGQEFQVGRQ